MMKKRTAALLLTLLLLMLPLQGLAARTTATPPVEPEATLYPDAPAYDAEHPENLDADQLYAWSAILIEAKSGQAIFEKSADDIRYPASTTKIMTAFLALTMLGDDEAALSQVITCSETATAINNTDENISTMSLQPEEEITFKDLLYGTLLLSANDGANVLAEAVSGSIPAFVDLMNQEAALLGCENTHFANPHGLHDDAHYTTPRDMAIIARAAMKNDVFRKIVSTQSYSIGKTNKHRARSVNNTNELYNPGTAESANRYYFPDAIGVKTGYTDKAQYCFVGAAVRDGVELISVVMYTGKRSRWADTIKLMNYGFSQYTSVTPQGLYAMNPISIETSNYALDDSASGKLRLNCVPANGAASLASMTVTFDEAERLAASLRDIALFQYTRDFAAPIEAGEIMGTMTYFLEDGSSVVYNLTAARTVPVRENVPKTLEQIEQETLADEDPMPRLTGYLAVRILLPLMGIALVVTAFILLMRRLQAGRHYSVSSYIEKDK